MKTWWLSVGAVVVILLVIMLVIDIEFFHTSGQQNDCVDAQIEQMIEAQKELNELYKELIELEELRHKLIIGKAWGA